MSNQDDPLAECCRHLAHSQQIIEEKRREIERLRLTEAERSVISFAADAYALNDDDHDCWRIAATLRGLLERLQ